MRKTKITVKAHIIRNKFTFGSFIGDHFGSFIGDHPFLKITKFIESN